MTVKTRADEMHDTLVEMYGPGSQFDLMDLFYKDYPNAGDYLTPGWLTFIRSMGAVGPSHADADYDFWKNRRAAGGSTLPGVPGLPPGSVLGSTGEAVWRAKDYEPGLTPQWLKDASGKGHHMRLGSVGRADIVGGALVLPGSVNNWADTVDPLAMLTGDLEVELVLSCDDFAPAQRVFTKWTSGQFGFIVQLAGGVVNFFVGTTPGNLYNNALSTASFASVGIVPGQKFWLKCTRQVSNGEFKFWVKTSEGAAYAQLGAAVVMGVGAVTWPSTAVLRIGNDVGSAEYFKGNIYRAIIRNGIGGTTVFDADFSTQRDGTPWFLETTGKRVTVFPARAAVVGGALYLPGGGASYQRAESPDSSKYPVGTQDIDLTWRGSNDDWAAVTSKILIAKGVTEATRAWSFFLSGVTIFFAWRDSGAVARTATTPHGILAGTSGDYSFRVTLDVDNGSGGHTVTFYKRVNDTDPWTVIATTNAGAFTTSIIDEVGAVLIGAELSGNQFSGKVYRAVVRNGIDGPPVLDCNFSTWQDGEGVLLPKYVGNNADTPVKVVTDTTGADTNDPLFLPFVGDKYVYLPGIAGNYISTPDSAALDIVGDITLDIECALDDWTPGATQSVFGKWGAAGQQSYLIRITTTGAMQMYLSVDGTAANNAVSSALIPVLDGQRIFLRASWKDSTDIVKFFTSPTGLDGSWTQLGTDQTLTCAGIFASTQMVEIGSQGSGTVTLSTGKFFKARIWNGYFDGVTQQGTKVFDWDASKQVEPYSYQEIGTDINLLPREVATLEAGGAGWNTNDSGNILVALETAEPLEGLSSLQLSRKTTTGSVNGTMYYAGGQVAVPCKPGDTLTASFDAKVKTGGTGRNMFAAIVWLDANGAGFTTSAAGAGQNDATQVRCSVTAVAPAGAAFASITCQSVAANVPTGEFHIFDKFQLEKASVASSYVPPRIRYYNLRTATGRKLAVVDRPMFLFGTDDYMECADHSALDMIATQSFSTIFALRSYAIGAGTVALLSKRAGFNAPDIGWIHFHSSNGRRIEIADGVNEASPGPVNALEVNGSAQLSSEVVDRIGQTVSSRIDAGPQDVVGAIAVGSLDNTLPVRIARGSGAGTFYAEHEFFGASIHRVALTPAQITKLDQEFGTNV